MTVQVIELRDSDKTVTYSGTPEEVELQCAALSQLDKRTEFKKKMLVVGAVVAFLLSIVGMSSDAPLALWLAAALLIGSGIYYYVINRDDIEDRKLDVAQCLVNTLKPELKANRPIQLALDFRGYDKLRADENWLVLSMTLEDGVGLRFAVSSRFKRKTQSKRKYTKIKDKLHERVTLTFVAPKGRAFDPAGKDRFPSHRVPRLRLRSVKITPKAATVVYATHPVQRVFSRQGWSKLSHDSVVQGSTSVAAIIASYRALGVAMGPATGGT